MERRQGDNNNNTIGFFTENQNDRHLGNGRPGVLIIRRNEAEILSARCRTGLCFSFTFFSIIIILVTAVDSGRSSTIIFGVIFSFLLLVGLVYFRYQQLHAHLDFNNNNNRNIRDNNNNNMNHNLFDDDDDEGLRLILELRRNIQAIQLLQHHQLAQQQAQLQRNNDSISNNRNGLTEEEISKLPKFIYKAPEDKYRMKRQRDDQNSDNNKNISDINNGGISEKIDMANSIKSNSSKHNHLNPINTSLSSSENITNDEEEGDQSITYTENGINYLYHLPPSSSSSSSSSHYSPSPSSSSASQKHLPVAISGINGDTHSSQSLECSICLDFYITDEVVIKLSSCCHMYHKHCVEEWLKKNNSCPLCKQPVRRSTPPLSSSSSAAALPHPLPSPPPSFSSSSSSRHRLYLSYNNIGTSSSIIINPHSNNNTVGTATTTTTTTQIPVERMIQMYDFRSSPSPPSNSPNAASAATVISATAATSSYNIDIQPPVQRPTSSSLSSSPSAQLSRQNQTQQSEFTTNYNSHNQIVNGPSISPASSAVDNVSRRGDNSDNSSNDLV